MPVRLVILPLWRTVPATARILGCPRGKICNIRSRMLVTAINPVSRGFLCFGSQVQSWVSESYESERSTRLESSRTTSGRRGGLFLSSDYKLRRPEQGALDLRIREGTNRFPR